jgi:hypothetical protein
VELVLVGLGVDVDEYESVSACTVGVGVEGAVDVFAIIISDVETGEVLGDDWTVGNVTASGVEEVAGATATCWIPVLVDDVDGMNDGLLVHDAGGAPVDGRLINTEVLVLVSVVVLVSVGRGVVDAGIKVLTVGPVEADTCCHADLARVVIPCCWVDCDAGGASVDGISINTEVLVPVSDGGGAVDAGMEASTVVSVRAGTCRGAF